MDQQFYIREMAINIRQVTSTTLLRPQHICQHAHSSCLLTQATALRICPNNMYALLVGRAHCICHARVLYPGIRAMFIDSGSYGDDSICGPVCITFELQAFLG